MRKRIWIVLLLVMVFAVPILGAAVDSPEMPEPEPEIEEIIEEYQTIYRLTINYIYDDGTPAAPTYTEQLDVGTPYNVVSPEIIDYTPTIDVVNSIMPPRDVEITVIYIPAPDPENPDVPPSFFTIEDYETPLGVGQTIMNVGICIE